MTPAAGGRGRTFLDSRTATALGALWGFAEATLFFVVPDVWIGATALFARRTAVVVLAATVAGAVIGGAATYAFAAATEPATSARVMDAVPTVGRDAIERVEGEMRKEGPRSALRGPLRLGTPYKLYARAAAIQDQSVTAFLLWSIPARLLRMLLVVLGAMVAGALARRWLEAHVRAVLVAYALAWLGFYVFYAVRVGL